jgi:hypothetical protein
MKRLAAVVFLLAVGLAGCHRAPARATGPHTHDLFEGKYFIEIDADGTSVGRVHSRTEGAVRVVERAEFEWVGGNTLVIDKGELTMNGRNYGTLSPGDRVRVGRDGQLTVNGTPREPKPM